MSRLVEPHGGTLVDRFVPAEEVEALRHRAESLPQITLDAREQADLELIATGAASPLIGFLGLRRLPVGAGAPAPGRRHRVAAALHAGRGRRGTRDSSASASDAALGDAPGRVWGVIRIQDVFTRDPLEESRAVYGTEDPTPPRRRLSPRRGRARSSAAPCACCPCPSCPSRATA